MRILNWNIRNGGSKNTINEIVAAAIQLCPDAIVISEFRKGKGLSQRFQENGYEAHIPLEAPSSSNQVAIFSSPSVKLRMKTSLAISNLRGLCVLCESEQMNLLGVFFPQKGRLNSNNNASIHSLIHWLNDDPLSLAAKPTVLTGDFNYGISASHWNKRKTGPEYNYMKQWLSEGIWNDYFPEPTTDLDYPPTFRGLKNSTIEPGHLWAKGSSRPDHFFHSKSVRAENVHVITGIIDSGLSDHEPIVGEFTTTEDNVV